MSHPKRIGIVGGGQLGRMLTIPAKEMGFNVTVLDATAHCPAAQVGAKQIIGALTDPKAIHKLAKGSDILTFEIEHIDAETLDALTKEGRIVHPSPKTLQTIKDKLLQKQFLNKNNIPTAPYVEVKTKENILDAVSKFDYPLVLKSRFGGYDGRGNALIQNENDIASAFEKLGRNDLYIEQFVQFNKELAVMVARSTKGDIKTYPVVETVHKNSILHYVLAPAPITKSLQQTAEKFAVEVMKHLGGAGVFGVEMFLKKNGEIFVNEIAPRVHNSGHYTIEASVTSQFENHIRAIAGLPLGETAMKTPAAAMVNILGERKGKAMLEGLEKALAIQGVSVHIYGKAETRPERKMGHITVVGNNVKECLRKAKLARKAISI